MRVVSGGREWGAGAGLLASLDSVRKFFGLMTHSSHADVLFNPPAALESPPPSAKRYRRSRTRAPAARPPPASGRRCPAAGRTPAARGEGRGWGSRSLSARGGVAGQVCSRLDDVVHGGHLPRRAKAKQASVRVDRQNLRGGEPVASQGHVGRVGCVLFSSPLLLSSSPLLHSLLFSSLLLFSSMLHRRLVPLRLRRRVRALDPAAALPLARKADRLERAHVAAAALPRTGGGGRGWISIEA